MEFIGVVVAYVVISFIWNTIKESFRQKKLDGLINEVAEERKQNAFQAKIIEDSIKGEDYNWDAFNIQVKGIIEGPHDNFEVKLVVRAFDITDEELPILANFEDFQAEDSRIFFYESETDELPYQDTIFKNWWTVTRIPKLFLEYPRRGNRKVEFRIFVIDALTRDSYAYDTKIITYYNDENGYLDNADNIEYFEEMSIKSAMLVSASDGSMHLSEANVVKSWIQKRLSGYNDHAVDDAKKRLNSYVKDAYQEIEDDSINIYEVLEGIENITSEGEKFELFQLCLDVAKADGKADDSELAIIRDIAEYINLDKKQFNSMMEKTLPITMYVSQADGETLLGIDTSMSNKEIRKYLREQYTKWNARVASSDPVTREQAEKMIQIIAEARKKYA